MFKGKEKDFTPNTQSVGYRYFFSGTYVERIDHKNRVTVPLPWRHILKDKVIITKNNVGCLVMWTTGFFQYSANLKIEKCTTEQEKQVVKRIFIGSARTLDIDAKGRIVIDEDLLALISTRDDYLYFVGAGDYVEIWAKELFESWKSQQMPKDIKNEEL